MTMNSAKKIEYPHLMVSKMTRRIWWTFIRVLESLKKLYFDGLLCSKHIMFQLENFRGIMCHATEG